MSESETNTNVTTFPAAEGGKPQNVAGVAGERLVAFLDRIERLEEEKKGIAEDIKEVYAEAKYAGFDPKIMRKVLKMRQMDANKLLEEEALIDTYRSAIGMV